MSHGVRELEALEVFFVIGHHHAIVRQRHRGEDHVESASRAASGFSFRHQACPDESSLGVKHQDSTCKQRLRPFLAREPCFKSVSLATAR